MEILGKEHVPDDGVLVIPNGLRAADLAQLERLFGQRAITLLAPPADTPLPEGLAEVIERRGGSAHRLAPASAGAESGADPAAEAVRAALASGGVVIAVPPAVKSRPASTITLPSHFTSRLLAIGVPVLPLFVDHPREYGLAIEAPRDNPESVFSFGKPVAGGPHSSAAFLESLLGASEASFSNRPVFKANLAQAIVQGIKRHGSRGFIYDGMDGSELRFDKLLAAAIAVSKVVRESTDQPRVGVVLPPGKAVFVANLAVLLAGKTPVNLNFTAGHDAINSAVRQSGVDRFITADPFVRKMQTFPWPPNRQLIFLERTIPQLKSKITRWFILSKLLPAPALCRVLGLPSKGGRNEAVLLFTSGSSGEPKGVVLSHRNLLANVSQFSSRLGLGPGESLLGCLPIFHSFGTTVTMLFPLLEGVSVVTFPSPIDATKLAPLIEEHKISLVVSTPTFLRGYMRKVKREQLASVRYFVSGAEKLPRQFAEAFAERFGHHILEGYGLTETSPATNVNLPDPGGEEPGEVIPAERPGTTGQLLPGIAVRVSSPDSGEPLPIDQSGIIWFRGANIFEGYLNQPAKTEEVLQDGWFRTGDIGRVDGDGFLSIEGRLSRFSKIGGEMVPHETVEQHICQAYELDNEDERKIAVVGIPDEDKGEQLVLLSTVAGETISQELIHLRYTLLDRGVPALWIPKKLIRIEDVPLLASGKLDIRRCEEIARQPHA